MADNQPVFPVSFRPCFSHIEADHGQNQGIEQDVSSMNPAVDTGQADVINYSCTRDTMDFSETKTSHDLSFSNTNFLINCNLYEKGSTENVNIFTDPSSESGQTQNSQFGFTSPFAREIKSHDGKDDKNLNIDTGFYVANHRSIENTVMSGMAIATASNEPVNKEYLDPADASVHTSYPDPEIYIENCESEMPEVKHSYLGDQNEEKSKITEKAPEKSAFIENDDNEIMSGNDHENEMVDDNDSDAGMKADTANDKSGLTIDDDDDDDSGTIVDNDDDSRSSMDGNDYEKTSDNDNNETSIDNDCNNITANNDSEIVYSTDESDEDEWGKKKKAKRKKTIPTKKDEGQKMKSKSAILTEKKEHKCPTCGKIVQSLRSFEKHLNLHTDRYACKICKKCFNSQNSLNTHKKVHEGYIGDEKCNVCDKTFYDKSSLNKHTLSVHMGITNFQCEYCEKSFFAKKTYEEHVRVHTGERPFKCSMCPKAYKRISDLNHHLRLHKGETKHTCEYCGEGFRRVSELKRHTQKHEAGASDVKHQIHECEWCKVRFSTGKALKQHLNTHLESMCFDGTIMQKVYGESQRLVDGIIQGLSGRIGAEIASMTQSNQHDLQRDLGLQQGVQVSNLTGITDYVPDTQPATAKSYTSVAQIHAEREHSPKVVDQPTRLLDTENSPKVSDQSSGPQHTESSPKVGTQPAMAKDHTTLSQIYPEPENSLKFLNQPFRLNDTQVSERTERHLNQQQYIDDHQAETVDPENNIPQGKFEIKIENVEEDGVNNMYVGKIHGAQHFNSDELYNNNEAEDYSNIKVKQEYDRDSDVEDYSYIIKSDFDEDDYDNDPTFDAGQYLSKSNQQSRKRSRKGQPLKRPRKPKSLKVTNDTEIGKDNVKEMKKELSKSDKQKKKGRPSKKRQRGDEEQLEDEYLGVAPITTGAESKPKKKRRTPSKPSALEEKIPDCSSYICEECGKKFSSKSCFRKHKNLHSGIYSCGICGKSCGTRNSLEIHEGRHEGRKPQSCVCNVCDKEFYDPSSLNKHVKNVHMNFRPYPCTLCDRKFQEKKTLEEHLRVHTGERPFECQVCGKTYKRKSELNFHFKKHTGETKFTCIECDKGFRRLSELKHHNVVHHSAERKFHCALCFKKFSTNVQLKEHSNIHFGTKNHECPKCFKAFYTKSKLRKHMRIKKDCSTISIFVNGVYVCNLCQFECETRSELRTHIKTLHESSGNLSRNRVHLCKVCGKEFKRSGALQRHMKIHTQTRDYMCNICGASFIQKHHLRQHMNTHTGEKPYQCDICLKCFAQNATLYSHMKHHLSPPVKSLKTATPQDSEAGSE